MLPASLKGGDTNDVQTLLGLAQRRHLSHWLGAALSHPKGRLLVVIGVSQLPAALSGKRRWMGWHGFFWMVGLAILFWSGHFWPGILILVGVSAIIEALMREHSPAAGSTSSEQEPFALEDLPKENGGGDEE